MTSSKNEDEYDDENESLYNNSIIVISDEPSSEKSDVYDRASSDSELSQLEETDEYNEDSSEE